MRRAILFIVLFSVAGAVLGWCYTWLREPLFLSEAAISVKDALSYEKTVEVGRQMRGESVLRAAADLSKVKIAEEPRTEVVGEGRLRIGCVAYGPMSAESFLRAWIACYQQERALGLRESRREMAERLRERLDGEVKAYEEARDALRSFFTEKVELSPEQAEVALKRLGGGEELREIVGENKVLLEKEIMEAERKLQKVQAKERILSRSLENEQKYIVAHQVKEKNPVVLELRQQLTDKQMELNKLLVDSSEKHPLVKRLRSEIEKIEELLESKEKESVTEERLEINPVYEDIALDLSRTERERDTIETHINLLRQALAREKERIALVSSEEARAGSLIGEYRARSRVLREDRALLEELEAGLAGGRRDADIEIVDIVSPGRPLNPSRWGWMIALGALAGAGVGLLALAALPKLRRTNPSNSR